MSDFVLDASLALQWLFEDELDRKYGIDVLASLSKLRALVPVLWFYEVGNGLVVAERRKRVTNDTVKGFIVRLRALPIDTAHQTSSEIFNLPAYAQLHGLTNYDAAYLQLADQQHIPIATADVALRAAAAAAAIQILAV